MLVYFVQHNLYTFENNMEVLGAQKLLNLSFFGLSK